MFMHMNVLSMILTSRNVKYFFSFFVPKVPLSVCRALRNRLVLSLSGSFVMSKIVLNPTLVLSFLDLRFLSSHFPIVNTEEVPLSSFKSHDCESTVVEEMAKSLQL